MVSLRFGLSGLWRQEDLEAAGGPAQLLLGVGLDGLRGVADGERLGDVDRLPATLVQHQRGPHVLGLGVGVDATDVVDRGPSVDHVRADREGGVEVVATGLDELVEDGLHVARTAGDQVDQVAVGLRGLHEGDVVVDEERHRLDQELRLRHEVGVQDDEEVTLGDGQGVVDVARLGAVGAEPADVVAADLVGQGLDVVGATVVQDPGAVLALDRQRGGRGCPDLVDVLAVDGDEHVDVGLLAVQQDGPELRAVGEPRGLDGLLVEHQPLGLVEGELPRALATGQDRPHRQEGVRHQDHFGDDHQGVGEQVPSVARVQQELRVEQDAQGGDQAEQDHHGRVRVCRLRSAGDGHVFVDSCVVVGRTGHSATLHYSVFVGRRRNR